MSTDRRMRGPSPAVDSPSVWRGAELENRADWIHHVSADEVAELERSADRIIARGLCVPDFGKDDFPLPEFANVLDRIRENVVNGPGVHVLRGLPVDRWSREQCAITYWGIGAHIGEAVAQNAYGHVLGHVKDIGVDVDDVNNRGHRSRAALSYHNDIGGEIIGLFCLKPSKSGGLSSVVSAGALYNEMLKRRPDLLAELLQPMHLDRRGEVPEGWKPYYRLPVFSRHEGRLIVCFVRRFVESAQRFPELPRLTQAQWDALDMLRDLAASPEFSLDITFDPGDIQFVNNLTTMHSRTGYEDYPEPERKRHLLRLWLAVPSGWALPQAFYDRYGATTPGGRPTGIVVTDPREPAPMDVA
jgi:TfdA family taurine catabolism dioxygenase TauD